MAASKIKKEADDKLHYKKEALLEEYQTTFVLMTTVVGGVVLFALAYFFVMIVYLGGWSHTKHTPFVEQFGDRIEIEYDGKKLPIYQQQ